MRKIRLLLTGGGSGGHIYPLLAVAEQIKKQMDKQGVSFDLRYFGDPKEYRPYISGSGIKIHHITASKLRRYVSILNLIDFIKFIWSIPQALWKIFWFMPDVAFSKGGPGAIATVLACRFYKIPIIIHDSDAVPGLTSRITGKFANEIILAFENATQYFPDKILVKVLGNPIRAEIIPAENEKTENSKALAKDALRFNSREPLLLILGGSQGAEKINFFFLNELPIFIKKYQILHQIGVQNFEYFMEKGEPIFSNIAPNLKSRYRPLPFLQKDMKTALIAADLIIARAGAGTIFEIAANEKPSILIPLDSAANNHQNENAIQYEESSACIIIKEENLFGDLVLSQIDSILSNPERLKLMRESAKDFSKPNAAEKIAEEVIALTKK